MCQYFMDSCCSFKVKFYQNSMEFSKVQFPNNAYFKKSRNRSTYVCKNSAELKKSTYFLFLWIREVEVHRKFPIREEHGKDTGCIRCGVFPLRVTLPLACRGTGFPGNAAWKCDLTACYLRQLDLLCTCKSPAKLQGKTNDVRGRPVL